MAAGARGALPQQPQSHQGSPSWEKQEMKQGLTWAVIAIIFAFAAARPAQAVSTLVFAAAPVDGTRALGPHGRVYAGSEPVMTIGGHGAQSVADAVEVARRLNALAEAGLRPEEISVRRDRKSRTILGRGQPIVTVDRAQAKVHSTDVGKLAGRWSDNLAAVFGRPYLSATPVVVPIGETRTTALRGSIVGAVSVEGGDSVVAASYDKAARTIRILGQYPGRTELAISDERTTLRVPVRAARYAGRIAATLVAGVTGSPAPSDAIYRSAQAAVAASLALEPGAWAQINPRLHPVSSLAPGMARAIKVHVSAAGEDYLPYRAEPVVTVRNEPASVGRPSAAGGAPPADVLMVSNSPERLLAHGLWYEGSLEDIQSARLLYHHVNSSRVPSDLVIELWNVGEQATRVQIISGKGGPSGDEAYAGHRAATEFLLNRAANIGWIVPLPARTAVPVIAQGMAPGSTLSGLVELRKLGPGDVRLRCYLAPARSLWLPYPVRSYQPSPILGRWVYTQPQQEISAKYVVGRDWAFVTIGDRAVPGIAPGDELAGGYGVVYQITFKLINPTESSAAAEVRMEPGGGAARALLLVNGRPVEAALLKHGAEARIARYVLAPGEIRTVRVETMPQGGSNYPVRLFARAG
jgi:hypothetical protein